MRALIAVAVAAGVLVGCSSVTPGAADEPVPADRPSQANTREPTRTQQPERTRRSAPGPAASKATRAEPTRPPSRRQQARLDARLLAAAWRNDVAAAKRLIARGADVNAKDDTVQSAYLVATSEGYLDLLDLTLRHRADVTSLDSFNGTGLIRAAERGHDDIVGRLLQEGVAVDHVNNLGWTALLESVILGDGSQRYVDTVRTLVAGGADIDLAAERDGLTPAQHADARGQQQVLAVLRAASRSGSRQVERSQADAALLRAAASGDASASTLALRQGARIEATDARGRTPLLLAALGDRVDVARLLVNLGADPDAQDDQQDSAWLATGVTGSVAMAETLLPADPDLGLLNRFGGTSIIPASERGHVAYVRRVVRTGIDLDHVNDLGWSALLEAVVLGDGGGRHQQVVRALLGAGADPTIPDADGRPPVALARDRGQVVIARMLAAAERAGAR